MVKLRSKFKASVTKPDDLPYVYNFIFDILGPDITAYSQFENMYQKNKNISHNIQRINEDGDTDIKGFLSLSFLTTSALDDLFHKRLKTMQLTGEHQTSEEESPAGLYIGAVGACPQDRAARLATMRYFLDTIKLYTADSNCKILARPVSDVGMKITQSLGLVPMHEKSKLGELYVSR